MSEGSKHNETWIDAVRRKSQQSMCQLPDDSWAAITKAAGIEEQLAKRGRVARLWVAVAAAAAVVLVVGIAMLGVRFEPVPQPKAGSAVAVVSKKQCVGTPRQELMAVNGAASTASAEKKMPKTGDTAQIWRQAGGKDFAEPAQKSTSTDTKTADNGLEAEPQNDQCSSLNKVSSGAINDAKQPNTSTEERSMRQGNAYRGIIHKDTHGHDGEKEPGNALRLYGNGIILAQANSSGSGKVQTVMSNSDGVIFAAPRRTKFTYDHKIPITVGLSFSKRIPFNLELSTGLVYTLMESGVTAELTGQSFTQRVQFIGIPLGVRWNFWRWRHFDTYLGGEVLGEKVIDAKYGDDNIDVDRLQWSLHAIAGVRYNIGDHVGFYVEPKLSHYMTELPLTTIRNEHTLNMNVQFGLSVQF